MAFTASVVAKGISMGNQLIRVLNITADAAAGDVDTGMRTIAFSLVGSKSAPTAPNVGENAGASGTATAGRLALSNCTSGNIYRAIVYGS